jgi:hypothetical protein
LLPGLEPIESNSSLRLHQAQCLLQISAIQVTIQSGFWYFSGGGAVPASSGFEPYHKHPVIAWTDEIQ